MGAGGSLKQHLKKKKGMIFLERNKRGKTYAGKLTDTIGVITFKLFFIIMQVWNKQSIVTQTDAAGKEKEGAAPKM